MTVKTTVISCAACILAAIAFLAYVTLHDHGNLDSYVHAESAQRVTTIGERCETTHHQSEILTAALGQSNPQSAWFHASYARCLKSLAKVEARAGVTYKP